MVWTISCSEEVVTHLKSQKRLVVHFDRLEPCPPDIRHSVSLYPPSASQPEDTKSNNVIGDNRELVEEQYMGENDTNPIQPTPPHHHYP